jgi:hypothetical protein
MSQTRIRYSAEYMYPGSFFPESVHRALLQPTFAAAVAAGPDEDGYFRKDGWYAVKIHAITEKRFTSDDGEVTWVKQGTVEVGNWIVGDRIHWSEIDDTRENAILISNIKGNSRDGGYGVKTRAGNWQIASDYTEVISPTAVTA